MNDITELLNEQRDLLTQILRLTNENDFSGGLDEDKVDAFNLLYEKREPLMQKLQEIDQKLTLLCNGEKAVIFNTHGELAKEISELARTIYNTDEFYNKSAIAYTDALRGEIKGLKQGRAANEAYNEVYSEGGLMMDRKN